MKRLFFICVCLTAILSACKKEQIAPANQMDAFVKYYGHIRDQQASDVKKTADGGYILLGSSNSFSATNEDDYYLIKTDSLGNEVWSKTFGDGEGGFDEEGIALVVLANDEGYLVAGNRTKMVIVNGQSRPESTNIVLYKLDLEGLVVWEKVLRPNTGTTPINEFVKDVKQNPDGTFVLIGETSKVNTLKPEYTIYASFDRQDILVLKLDAEGNQIWASVRGFVGMDYGASVEFVNGDFIINGTTEKRVGGTQTSPIFLKKLLFARLSGVNGNETNVIDFGESNQNIIAAYTCYDSINGVITAIAHVDDLPALTDPKEGDFFICQVSENLVEVNSKYMGKTSGGIIGVNQNLEAGSIAIVPAQVQGDDPSFIITGTHGVGNGGSECVLLKLNPDLSVAWDGNARFFGRPGESGNWLPGNKAKRVIPVEKLVEGTTRSELTGYAFTGTFNLGTNNMIGLVKTNAEGTMRPIN
jgi:hypothetical protein